MFTAAMLALAAQQPVEAASQPFVEVDYGEVDRTLVKEPEYVGQPLYGLFVLDPAGRFACWAVFDRSKPDAAHTWGADEVELAPGSNEKIYVMIGKRGSTADSISVMSETFLDLAKDELTATLVVPTLSGSAKSIPVPIHEHC